MLPCASHLLTYIEQMTQAPIFTQLYNLLAECATVYYVCIPSYPKLKIWDFNVQNISQVLPELKSNSTSMLYTFKHQMKPCFRM